MLRRATGWAAFAFAALLPPMTTSLFWSAAIPVPEARAQVLLPSQERARNERVPKPRRGARPPAASASAALSSDALPTTVDADDIESQIDRREVRATGDVLLTHGDLTMRADRASYFDFEDRVEASGNVRVDRAGDLFWGPELSLDVVTSSGEFVAPRYWLAGRGAGGHAARAEFIDRAHARLESADYTSCPADGSGDPDWLLSADRLTLDREKNEVVAEGAVLRFLGIPVLGFPRMTFPISDDRKSGWLPPNLVIDSRSGIGLSAPYYWNIAPNQDATLTPSLSTRRGDGMFAEWRYLLPSNEGHVEGHWLPEDRIEHRSRFSLDVDHHGRIGDDTLYAANIQRASDDDYWKDFSHRLPSLTQRLLPQDVAITHRFDLRFGDAEAEADAYARVEHWQILQAANPDGIAPPYQRSPQVGLHVGGSAFGGIAYSAQTEVNRFTRPDADPLPIGTSPDFTGTRWHLLADASRRFGDAGWWLTPAMAVNIASYDTDEAMTDGRHSRSRTIPTASVDGGMLFERDASLFGHDMRQTLEPRLLYVRTPYRNQSGQPNYDSAPKDFDLISIFSTNAFSGVDWVSDGDQATVGATTRYLDAASGVELLRLGIAQRYLFSDQRITPDCTPDIVDTPACADPKKRLSDLLLLGSSRLLPAWALDGTVEYNPSTGRAVRSLLSARYNPSDYHVMSLTYRYARGLSEQFELGWQWPLYRGGGRTPGASNGCGGTLYGVGRVNYSTLDSRITDSIVGMEYDAGCWIGRVVAERLSTGRSEATTRLLVQLELTGLSRLGSNPLAVLMENIPGYRVLGADSAASILPASP